MTRALALLAFAAACSHTQPAPEPAQPPPRGFGFSKALAIEVCLPTGENEYFRSLRCASGSRPDARRLGNVGSRTEPRDPNDPRILQQMDPGKLLQPGEPDLHIVEAFEVTCSGKKVTLYVDSYHCARPVPMWAPEGFSRQQ